MTAYDVFNGDADGICALLQLRHVQPREAQLVTGVKRDIALLDRVTAGEGDELTVLDISMEKNAAALERLLAAGSRVFYADHHYPGDIPEHEGLQALIDTAPETCTCLIVNEHLDGAVANWAVVGAYGDNLSASADRLADRLGLDDAVRDRFARLGTYINYNGYGPTLDDLHFHPDDLYRRLRPFRDPAEFIAADVDTFTRLEAGYRDDMAAAEALEAGFAAEHAAVFMLPDAAWARRVSGVFGNDLANRFPERAHAVVTEKTDGGYLVSVRAPLRNRVGADEVCRQFATGGGRKAAAGINDLPTADLDRFIEVFSSHYAP